MSLQAPPAGGNAAGQQASAAAEPRSPIIDCGWYGDDKNSPTRDHLIVNARGREIKVPLGVTLLLHHVQKAIQAELNLMDRSFEVYDVHGSRLRTDQDLREAVMACRTPLAAQVSDTSMGERQEDQQEELAQIICTLIREHCSESDGKLSTVCQQVEVLQGEVLSHRRAMDLQVTNLRNELYSAIGSLKDIVDPLANASAGKVELLGSGDSVPVAALSERVEGLENQFQTGLHRLEARFDEMTAGLSGVLAEHEEYLTRVCTNATEEVQEVAGRFVELSKRLDEAERHAAEQLIRHAAEQQRGMQQSMLSGRGAFQGDIQLLEQQDRRGNGNPKLGRGASPIRFSNFDTAIAQIRNRSKGHSPGATSRPLVREVSASMLDPGRRAWSTDPPAGSKQFRVISIPNAEIATPSQNSRPISLLRSRGTAQSPDGSGSDPNREARLRGDVVATSARQGSSAANSQQAPAPTGYIFSSFPNSHRRSDVDHRMIFGSGSFASAVPQPSIPSPTPPAPNKQPGGHREAT